jgi:hypothetical protein
MSRRPAMTTTETTNTTGTRTNAPADRTAHVVRTPRRRLATAVWATLAGGTLLQVGGCLGAASPIILSLAESSLLTFLFGRGG